MSIELGSKLLHIEDIRDGMQKRFNSLKAELKRNNTIAAGNKTRAITYAKEMNKYAIQHFLEMKVEVER